MLAELDRPRWQFVAGLIMSAAVSITYQKIEIAQLAQGALDREKSSEKSSRFRDDRDKAMQDDIRELRGLLHRCNGGARE